MTACYSDDQRCPPPQRTPLCENHISLASRAARLLVYDHGDLDEHLAKSLGVWPDLGMPTARNAALPVPIRVDVEALQRHIFLLTVGWARIVAVRCGLSQPPRTGPVRDDLRAVAWAARVLTDRIDVLARIGRVPIRNYPVLDKADPPVEVCGARGALDLLAAHQHAHVVMGLTNLVRKLPGACQFRLERSAGHCGRRLFQDNGQETVYCEVGHRITRDDYERYGNLFLRPKEVAA